MPELSSESWAEVRSLYEAGTLSVTKICKSYNVSVGTLYKHAVKESWELRETDRAGPKTVLASARRKHLVNKLSSLFEQQLVAIEKQGDGPDRLDTLERDCRALELLARTFDRLVQAEMRAMLPAVAVKGARNSKAGAEPANDQANAGTPTASTTEELRDELARRLYGLHGRSADPQVTGVPQQA